MKQVDRRIAYRIREAREILKLSRETMEEKCGISSKFLYEIENAHKDFTITTLLKICKTLKVSPNFILLGEMNAAEEIIGVVNQMNESQKKLSKNVLLVISESKE